MNYNTYQIKAQNVYTNRPERFLVRARCESEAKSYVRSKHDWAGEIEIRIHTKRNSYK